MKKFQVYSLIGLVFFTVVLLIAGCGGGGGSSSSGGGGATTGTVIGYVKDGTGTVLAGATVTTASGTATTDSNGAYTVTAPAGSRVKVTAKKTGYLENSVYVQVVAGAQSNANIILRAGAQATVSLSNLDIAAGEATNTARNDSLKATVQLPAGSVVNSDGQVVSSANVAISNAVTSDPGYADFFPGSFQGETLDGSSTPIESFGFMDVKLTDANGNELNLKNGSSATIKIPVSTDPGLDTIPLWYLDEVTGIWKETGTATRVVENGITYYQGQVTHFSTYNLDRAFTGGTLRVTVKQSDMTFDHHHYVQGRTATEDTTLRLAPGAEVRVTVTSGGNLTNGSSWQGRGVTGSDGTVTLTVPGGNLNIYAVKGEYSGYAWGYSVTGNEQAEATVTMYKYSYTH